MRHTSSAPAIFSRRMFYPRRYQLRALRKSKLRLEALFDYLKRPFKARFARLKTYDGNLARLQGLRFKTLSCRFLIDFFKFTPNFEPKF